MVLNLARVIMLAIVALVLALSSAPGAAHKDHNKQQQAARSVVERDQSPSSTRIGADHATMENHVAVVEVEAPESFSERLMSWVGRTHPFAVHFPIALFPVALVALILARRRGETVELIRALIIVAGAASLIAAVLGWLTAGFVLAEDDAFHFWHRWIGTALAVIGGAVAVWALRRRDSVHSRGMVAALAAITLSLLVQGWLGAALVHGTDHMKF